MDVLTYTVYFALVIYSQPVQAPPMYGLGSPENILNYETYDDDLYSDMLEAAYHNNYRGLYAITNGEDDPFLDPTRVDLWRWKGRVIEANNWGIQVSLFLAEEETMNNPWREWYETAVYMFGDLNIDFIISEEYDQPPHALSAAEVEERCSYLRELGYEGDVGIHDTGLGLTGLYPFLHDSSCIDVLYVQWFRTNNWYDIYEVLGHTTNKEVIIAESPTTLTYEDWCRVSEEINDVGWGAMYYHAPADLSWNWFNPPLVSCN